MAATSTCPPLCTASISRAAAGLGQYLHDNPSVPACFARKLYAYGVGANSAGRANQRRPGRYLDGLHRRRLPGAGVAKAIVTSPQFFTAPPPATLRPRLALNERVSEDIMASTRRSLLRGLFQGSAAVMALPFLDCFLDSNGQALAADRPAHSHPLRHVLLGLRPDQGTCICPRSTGANYEDMPQLASLKPYKAQAQSAQRLSRLCRRQAQYPALERQRRHRHRHRAQPRRASSMPRPLTRPSPTSSVTARASAPSRSPAPATSARAIPAWAAPTSIRRRFRPPGFTPACSAPASRIRPRATGSPIPKSCCSKACCRWWPMTASA